jgi:hypothetical protein
MEPENEKMILSYLNNEMDEKERQVFELACKNDAKLQDQLKNELKVRISVKQHATKVRREFYAKAPLFKGVEKTGKQFFFSSYLKIAASVLLLITAGYIIHFYSQTTDTLEIFDNQFQPYIISSERSTSSDMVNVTDSLWRETKVVYQNREWIRSKELLSNLLKREDFLSPDLAKLMLANLALIQSDSELALEILDKIDHKNLALKYDVSWYKALSYLQLENQESALQELEALQESKVYRQRAQEIINEL